MRWLILWGIIWSSTSSFGLGRSGKMWCGDGVVEIYCGIRVGLIHLEQIKFKLTIALSRHLIDTLV